MARLCPLIKSDCVECECMMWRRDDCVVATSMESAGFNPVNFIDLESEPELELELEPDEPDVPAELSPMHAEGDVEPFLDSHKENHRRNGNGLSSNTRKAVDRYAEEFGFYESSSQLHCDPESDPDSAVEMADLKKWLEDTERRRDELVASLPDQVTLWTKDRRTKKVTQEDPRGPRGTRNGSSQRNASRAGVATQRRRTGHV